MNYLFSFSVFYKSNSLYAEYLFHKTFRRDRDDLQSYSDYQNNKYIQMQQTPLVQRWRSKRWWWPSLKLFAEINWHNF